MARTERMVTRTIITMAYTCMVVKNGTEVSTELVILGNTSALTDDKIEKLLKEKCENLFVKINSVETIETIYGMTESDFVKYGHIVER